MPGRRGISPLLENVAEERECDCFVTSAMLRDWVDRSWRKDLGGGRQRVGNIRAE